MAKRTNNSSNLLRDLSRITINGQTITQTTTRPSSRGQSSNSSEKLLRPSAGTEETRTSSMSATENPTGINFGKPASSGSTSAASGSTWTGLLKQAASGGAASLLGGGISSIFGLGDVISGIASLFGGGKSTPPPLVQFTLPSSQVETAYVSTKGAATYQGAPTLSQKPPTVSVGGYSGGATKPQNPPSQSPAYQNAQIVQAVKNALLNSSSLNDVIAEI